MKMEQIEQERIMLEEDTNWRDEEPEIEEEYFDSWKEYGIPEYGEF